MLLTKVCEANLNVLIVDTVVGLKPHSLQHVHTHVQNYGINTEAQQHFFITLRGAQIEPGTDFKELILT